VLICYNRGILALVPNECQNKFKEILESNGINATIRKEKGADIDGACGQLRYKIMHKKREIKSNGEHN